MSLSNDSLVAFHHRGYDFYKRKGSVLSDWYLPTTDIIKSKFSSILHVGLNFLVSCSYILVDKHRKLKYN